MTVKAHNDRIFVFVFSDGHTEFSEVREQISQKVSAKGGDGFPTDTELTAIKISFSPEEEGQSHRKGLPTAHGAVADNGVKSAGVPPSKDLLLFRRRSYQASQSRSAAAEFRA